ncbi:PSD1 and planctomycete cytochrome C domain-containing protein [Thalassoroseus pseudoceratinae]|uniref:PSD1 and planctomycete cytochrome C domain-containing protein n=1 Tax=Thalassoroseus pseudoceratinae TaxID=2713176 RepID=UPI00141F0D02|nr:PSD1 and planctomycete cytochrome C domain-containing protein [Thalassoroseus pseudoceratinae]
MMNSLFRTTFCLCVIAMWGQTTVADSPPIEFQRDIEPLLTKHCSACHGVDKQEGGLRLDHRATALRGGDSGPLLEPKKSEKSELWNRISSDDESLKMPPPYEDDIHPLSDDQIALIGRWIDAGADWPDDGKKLVVKSDHWSYQPLQQTARKGLPTSDWVRNDIDRFVLAKLQEAGVEPSPRADRHVLLKRLFLDLTGLPPTPAEVEEFIRDKRTNAYEHAVDRLLSSPHFGERWGRHWLDKARYADSDGYEKDRPRMNAWRYRDWVIDAINDDLPVDEFTIQQLAGDLLPNATPDQKLATAFHRQTLTNTEGGTDQEEFRVAAVFDRVDTTGTVWLGLTVGCAQCHSHKYDQISQAEYYQLFAFFNNGDETNTEVAKSEAELERYRRDKATHDRLLAAHAEKIHNAKQEFRTKLDQWADNLQQELAKADPNRIEFHPLEIVQVKSTGGATFDTQTDGSYLATGKNPASATYTIIAKTDQKNVTGLRLRTLADPKLPSKGPGRTAHGNFVLNEFQVQSSVNQDFKKAKPQPIQSATADFSQNKWDVAGAFDGKPKSGWAISPQMGKDHEAVFVFATPVNGDGKSNWIKIELQQNYGSQHTIGRFHIEARTGTEPGEGVPAKIREIVQIPSDQRSVKQNQMILDYAFADSDTGRVLLKQQEQLKKKAPQSPFMTVRVISQRTKSPRTTHLLRRGDFLQPQGEVEPNTLAVLPPLTSRDEKSQPDRLDLALWLVSDENPLTPRVLVNHIWRPLFGRGLVPTMNDFGVRGEPPTHPRLLDDLAHRFRTEFGWSRKKLIKYIVMSATYQQSSQVRPDLQEQDPQNNWLARQNRFRVEAELVRDVYLAASGSLSRKVGGPSVFPPMPSDVAALSYANNFRWKTSDGEDRYRRGMYTFFKRTAPHPNLTTFDCPDGNTTLVERRASNTPLMALTTLNNLVFVEAAQALAERLLTELPSDDDDEARIRRGFEICTARPASSESVAVFRKLLQSAREYYEAHPEAAIELTKLHRSESVSAEESAAWVVVARMMLNLDEVISRE